MHRIDRREHRNSAVTKPAVHAENCSSSAQTHITHTSGNGQCWEQTETDAYAGDINSEWREDKKLVNPHRCGISTGDV
jgi:hypothetical protein